MGMMTEAVEVALITWIGFPYQANLGNVFNLQTQSQSSHILLCLPLCRNKCIHDLFKVHRSLSLLSLSTWQTIKLLNSLPKASPIDSSL